MIDCEKAVLRRATERDRDLLFTWVNEENVRTNAFDSHLITQEEHAQWFKKAMASQNIVQYIYEYKNQPVGQSRIEIHGEEAIIDYSISSDYRGQGHGKCMLNILEQKVLREFPDIRYLVGKVKASNLISKKVFTALDYEENYTLYRKTVKL